MKQDFPSSVPITGRVRVCLELLRNQDITGKVIVDVGSSFGWLEKNIVKVRPKKIVGVEFNEQALKFAQKQGLKAEFKLGSALDLPLKSNISDIVLMYDVIEHLPIGSELQALNEANRILKKGGILLLSTPFDNSIAKFLDLAWYFGHRHYSKDKIKQLLKRSGFKLKALEVRGSFFSSLYLAWFYVSKKLFKVAQPRNKIIESLDDLGYNKGKITDIFLIAEK